MRLSTISKTCSSSATARVATITINRPKVLNALNTQTLDELRRAILDAEARRRRARW